MTLDELIRALQAIQASRLGVQGKAVLMIQGKHKHAFVATDVRIVIHDGKTTPTIEIL